MFSPLSAFEVSELDLPNCSSLFLQTNKVSAFPSSPFARIAPQLPIRNLTLQHLTLVKYDWYKTSFPCDSFDDDLDELLGLRSRPSLWTNLNKLVFRNTLWYDYPKRLSFSDWSFKVVVVEVAPKMVVDTKTALSLFLEPSPKENVGFLEDVERIEFKIRGGFAREVEQNFRNDATRRKGRGLSELEKRLLPLMVFVGDDGVERKLLKGDE